MSGADAPGGADEVVRLAAQLRPILLPRQASDRRYPLGGAVERGKPTELRQKCAGSAVHAVTGVLPYDLIR